MSLTDKAKEEVAKQTASLSSYTDDLWGLFTKGVSSYIDKETRADDVSAPGVEDQVYYGGSAVPISQQVAGQSQISPLTMIVGGVVAVVALVVVLKKV